MIRSIIFAWVALVIFGQQAFSQELVTLKGELVQGGIILGKVPGGTKVSLNGTQIRVSVDGNFVFGFGRDAEGPALLRIQNPNGTVETRELAIKKRTYNIQKIEGVASKYVSPPKEVSDRISRDAEMVAIARTSDFENPMYAGGFVWPAKGRLSGFYGSQRVFNGVPKRPHFGVDVAAPIGTPITAPAEGIVTLAEPDLYYSGGTVILDHGQGLSSSFLHMDSVTVKVGDLLQQGDQLGTMGEKGRVTGPHLDWRMNWFKERVDPQTLVVGTPN